MSERAGHEPFDIGFRRGFQFAADADTLPPGYREYVTASHTAALAVEDLWERKYSEGFLAGAAKSRAERSENCHENNLSLWQES